MMHRTRPNRTLLRRRPARGRPRRRGRLAARPLGPALAVAVAVAVALGAAACGGADGGADGGGGRGRGDAGDGAGSGGRGRLASQEEWCEAAGAPLPALEFTSAAALDDPEAQRALELEAVDAHRRHYRRLARGAPGVPDGVTGGAARLADRFEELHDRVRGGEPLPAVLAEMREPGGGHGEGGDDGLVDQVSGLAGRVEQVCG